MKGKGIDMTDKEKLVALLTEFGVEWRAKGQHIKCGGYNHYKKIIGFNGFYTEFEFDIDGKFLQMGAWE